MRMRKLACPVALALSACLISPTMAATALGSFTVRITINAECLVSSATDLDFGARGVLTTNTDQVNLIGVQCTTGTPYTIGLNAGAGAGATVANRLMTSPAGGTVGYTLYRDTARTLLWGNTVGTDTVASTGNGSVQNFTVYGRVPPQSTPASGAYTDTITVTVTY